MLVVGILLALCPITILMVLLGGSRPSSIDDEFEAIVAPLRDDPRFLPRGSGG